MPNTNTQQSTLVGRKVFPKDGGFYEGHWGFITRDEGDGMFIVAGGSLGDMEPLLHRVEFRVPRRKTTGV